MQGIYKNSGALVNEPLLKPSRGVFIRKGKRLDSTAVRVRDLHVAESGLTPEQREE